MFQCPLVGLHDLTLGIVLPQGPSACAKTLVEGRFLERSKKIRRTLLASSKKDAM